MAKNRIRFSNDFILKDEKVGINTTEPQALLDVGGELKVSGIATFQNNIRVNGITVGVGTRTSTNISIGDNALLVDSASTTNNNIAIGNNALRNNLGGAGVFGRTNIAIGGDALKNNSAEHNTAIGYRCLENNQGYHNIAVGYLALRDTTTGGENTSVGGNSNIRNISGSQNSSLGHNSLDQNLSGSHNVALGKDALVSNTTGSYNIGLGVYNGISTNKSGNILIGSGVLNYNFDTPKNASNQLAIGRRTGSGAASYWIVGDENYNVGVGVTNPTEKLEVGGNLKVSGTIYGAINTDEVIYNSIQSSSSGIVTLTSNTSNQIVDSFDESSILNAKYQISVACTGQLAGSYENPSTASVGVITAGQFYIPGTYNNVRLYTQSGVGTDARANITVNGTYRIVGFTSAYNTLVTTSAHGLGTNQPISFDSSFQRAEYVTLVESDTFYTPVPHGIGTNEPVSFASSIFDSSYTGIAVTAGVGNTYYATGTGATSFTLEYNIGGGQIVGLGTTTFASPGNKVTLVGSAITAGTIYYATGTGTTTFTLSSESTGIGTIVGVAISTGLSIGCTISSGVSAVRIVNPGSGYNVGAALSVLNTDLNSPVGSGFSFVVSNAYTNYQTTEVLLMTNNGSAGIRTCDYIEYATLANNDILGTFDASLNGSTAQLRFSPFYQNSTIKYAKTSIIN